MKLKLVLSTTIGVLFITGCSKSEHNADAKTVLPKHAIQSAALGSIEQCKSYT
ncbi:formylglycine-generating enzyme family protein, partial [Acinetobacter baumannii]